MTGKDLNTNEDLVVSSFDGPLTPEGTSRAPYTVNVTCATCGRTASPKLDRWRFKSDWTTDWVSVFAKRAFRCRCGGLAGGLRVTRTEADGVETILKVEHPHSGSYAQHSGH